MMFALLPTQIRPWPSAKAVHSERYRHRTGTEVTTRGHLSRTYRSGAAPRCDPISAHRLKGGHQICNLSPILYATSRTRMSPNAGRTTRPTRRRPRWARMRDRLRLATMSTLAHSRKIARLPVSIRVDDFGVGRH